MGKFKKYVGLNGEIIEEKYSKSKAGGQKRITQVLRNKNAGSEQMKEIGKDRLIGPERVETMFNHMKMY